MNWAEVFAGIKERTLVGGCPPETYDEYIAELLDRGLDELEAHKTAYAVLGCYDAHRRLAQMDEEGE